VLPRFATVPLALRDNAIACAGVDCQIAALASTMTVSEVMAIVGPFLGFFSGWGVSTLADHRKSRLARHAIRQALIVELERAELRLSTAVSKYAYLAETPAQVARVAAELRWFIRVGETRAPGTGVTLGDAAPGMVDRFSELPDAVMVSMWATHSAQETVGGKYLLPVLGSTLAGRLEGLTTEQIQALSELGSQMHMLSQEADYTMELWRQTFTITDERNHAITLANHRRRAQAYARRAAVALDCTRAALLVLGGNATYPV
jgi:hypothetical protein